MKSQAIIISAYLASILIILLIITYYINILPYSTTINIRTRNYEVYSIIYSKVSWTARELAYTIIDELKASYVVVNITVINITDRQVNSTDYYSIIPNNQNVTLIYEYNVSRLDDNGLFYSYYIKVGFR